jgi:hypothetical protein
MLIPYSHDLVTAPFEEKIFCRCHTSQCILKSWKFSLVFSPFYWVLKKGKEIEKKEGISQHHFQWYSKDINLDKCHPLHHK